MSPGRGRRLAGRARPVLRPLRRGVWALMGRTNLKAARLVVVAALTVAALLFVLALVLGSKGQGLLAAVTGVLALAVTGFGFTWLIGEITRVADSRQSWAPRSGRTSRTAMQLSGVVEHFQMANVVRIDPQPAHHGGGRGDRGPAVTVVVTSRNRAALLANALSSVQQQDFPDWECLVVDDGSTDGSRDVARGFASADKRFRIFTHATPRGPSAARNTALLRARGEFVCFLDDDDVLFPESLSQRLAAIVASDGCAGSYCDWVSFWGTGAPEVQERRPRVQPRITAFTQPWDCPFIVSAPLVRRSVLLDMGGFNESLGTAEDAELWLRVLRAGYTFEYAPVVGVGYRQIPTGLVRQTTAKHASTMSRLAESMDLPVDDPQVLSGPRPLLEPLGYYLRERALVPRLLRFMAISLAAGDEDGARAVAARINPTAVLLDPDPSMVPHSIEQAIRRIGWDEPPYVLEAEALRRRATALAEGLVSEAASHRERVEAARAQLTTPPARAQHDLRAREGEAGGELAGSVTGVRELHAHTDVIGVGQQLDRLEGAVLLVPESRYHVDEFGPLFDELRARGVTAAFMARKTTLLREEVLAEISRFSPAVWEWDEALPEKVHLGAVVVMNDWGPGRELVASAQRAGTVALAKVEGVQDFRDRDTGRERAPYQTAELVLGQGPNDVRALPEKNVHVVGSSRLEGVWAEPLPTRTSPRVVINLNFTYNVQTEHANSWLDSVVTACRRANLDYVISPHPAQRIDLFNPGLVDNNIATAPMRHLLTDAGVLVTRFSTVVYESIARGVPVVYHNPHGEAVWLDLPGVGEAITTTASTPDLAAALQVAVREREGYRDRAAPFFQAQVDLGEELCSARTADYLVSLLHDDRRAVVPARPA